LPENHGCPNLFLPNHWSRRVKDQLWRDYGAPADRDKFTYTYDRNSNRLYRENTGTADLDELYAYDNLNRLTTFHRGDLDGDKDEIVVADREYGEAWDLTAVGNWEDYQIDHDGDGDYDDGAGDLDQDRTHNLVNEIWNATAADAITEGGGQTAWASPVYSARGNMTSVPTPSDLTAVYTVTYDAWNRLVEVKSGANVVLKCEYDGLGRRTKKHINTGVDQVYDEFRHFYYNVSWQILETRLSESEDTAPDGLQPEYQYVWSLRYIDAPVLRDENTDEDDLCDDERLYYLTDANMNVTCLTDTGGDAVERYVYDPYGNCTVYDDDWSDQIAWAASKKNNIRFCGYYFDNETGLYSVRNRVLHPYLGWLSRDPVGYADGMGLYEYVISNPVLLTDSQGHSWWDCCDECDKEHSHQKVSPVGWEVKWVWSPCSPDDARGMEEAAEWMKDQLGNQQTGDELGFSKVQTMLAEACIEGANRAEQLARKRDGVAIWIKVKAECCEQQSCWFFWEYLDWEEREYWHPCSARGRGRQSLGGFAVDDKGGIAKAISGCYQEATSAFDCQKAK